MLAATVLLSIASALIAARLIVNCTESMPLGLYWLARGRAPGRGSLVAFAVPNRVRALVHERAYLPDGAFLLKRVVAVPGDRVCTEGGVLSIDDIVFGPIAPFDRAGRPLPRASFCGTLDAGEVYVASRAARSFDSRAFGSVPLGDLRGTVIPLWTF